MALANSRILKDVLLCGVTIRGNCKHLSRLVSTPIKLCIVKEEALFNTLGRIGSKLTYLRKKKGYSSHEDFAYDYDLPRVQYWRIEKGKANITIKSLCRLLTIHDLSVEEFFYLMYKEYKESKKS